MNQNLISRRAGVTLENQVDDLDRELHRLRLAVLVLAAVNVLAAVAAAVL